MKKFIFIRHADIIRNSDNTISDKLTKKAVLYSKNLIQILKDSGITEINKVFYDVSDNNKRCFNTIKYLGDNQIKIDEPFDIIHDLNEEDEIIIVCYRLQSLNLILPLLGIDSTEIITQGKGLKMKNKNITDRPNFLYEYIFLLYCICIQI